MGPEQHESLEDRLERAKRHGYRIEVVSEPVSRDPNTRWRPKAVVWTRAETGAPEVLPLASERLMTFPTKREADAHALLLALKWVEERY